MVPFVLAAVLWQAPATLRIEHGEARRLTVPAVVGPARLVFRARADYWRPAGSNLFLRLRLNGEEIGSMRDRRHARLVNKPVSFLDGDQALSWFAFGRWRVSYGPVATARDEFVLDVSDLLARHRPSTLTVEHGAPGANGTPPLVMEHLRIEAGDAVGTDVEGDARAAAAPPVAATAARTATRPDWRTPRLRLPPPPRFAVAADPRRVVLTWAGGTVEVATTVVGGAPAWRRSTVIQPTHVEVRDTITNPGAAVVGLRVRHAVATDAAWVHLGGRPDPDVTDAYDPWNPTVFAPVAGGGVGLVAEDDVLRQQLHVDYDAAGPTIGLRTDMLCLDAGASVTLVWSIYPIRTESYWDFVNTVRADWGANRTIPGSYVWFQPDDVLAMPPERLGAVLARQRVAVASMWGGWVDPRQRDQPPRLGFGTDVVGDAFADYRARIRTAVARLKTARPGLVVLLYFDAQRESAPDATTRYAASLLRLSGGAIERETWRGRFSPAWSMVPTLADDFGRALGGVARALRALGGDGLYWDEMDGIDYRAPRVTTAVWDGHTCVLDADGRVQARIGMANLLSEAVKLEVADTGIVLGNMPPTTRRFQDRGDWRMVEAQHNDAWGAFAHLTTPLGYVGAWQDWSLARAKIDEPLLLAGNGLENPSSLPARSFPFTPEYIQPGTLRGRERIITTQSGIHGWTTGAAIRAFRFDADGDEHPAAWRTKRRHGGVFMRVRLAPGEAAVLERDE